MNLVLQNKKSIALLFIFLTLVLMGPFVFAQDAPPIANTELSSDSFLRFKDNVNMNCRNPKDLSKVNTVLGAGSVIQLPRGITEYDAMDGGVNFNKTIENWIAKSQSDPMYHSHRPFYLSCPNNQEECSSVDSSEPYLPIKVAKASDPSFDTNSTGAICYVALDYIKRNIKPHRYQTVRTNLQSALSIGDETNKQDVIAPENVFPSLQQEVEVVEGESEVTHHAPIASLRPEARPSGLVGENSYSQFRCRQSSYSRTQYHKNNCFARAGLTQKERAQIIMADVMEINRRRKGIQLDPRFSACVAYRESKFSPNAKGGTPDYGLYQVINSTARTTLRKYEPVTPGFSRYRYRWSGTANDPGYREAMLNSTLAQADLHHAVITGIANWKGYASKLHKGTASRIDYYNIARIYNGGNNFRSRMPTCYGQQILNCYDRMKSAATSRGTITNATQLNSALKAAKGGCR